MGHGLKQSGSGIEPSPERTKVILLSQVVVIVIAIVIWSMVRCRKQVA